jgi:nitrogen fixation/metabolism regulation signal transduction histidine kinase
MGDRVQLQQVIMNLLRNASDAMIGIDDPTEGRSSFSTSMDDGDRVCPERAGLWRGVSGRRARPTCSTRSTTTKPDGMGMGSR